MYGGTLYDLVNFARRRLSPPRSTYVISAEDKEAVVAVIVVVKGSPSFSTSSRYADLCHVIPPLSLPVPRVSCPSAIKFFLFETNNETFVQHRPTDGLPTKRNNRNETEENGLRRMDENSIPLFCLRSTKRDEPFLRRDGN